jgi:hypothetical protein
VGGSRKRPKLPEGYRLDLADDPGAPALRRPDGGIAARFSRRGVTNEAIEREAWEDLLYVAEEQRSDRSLAMTPGPT